MARKIREQQDRELRATAYHEAGHAVAHFFRRLPIRQVSIQPNRWRNTLGHVRGYRPKSFVQWLEGAYVGLRRESWFHYRAVSEIVCALAGSTAEKLATKRADHVGARIDYERAAYFAEAISATATQMSALLKWLEIVAQDLVKTRWSAVEVVAAALLDRTVLTGPEVATLCLSRRPTAPPAAKRTHRAGLGIWHRQHSLASARGIIGGVHEVSALKTGDKSLRLAGKGRRSTQRLPPQGGRVAQH